jgi:Zn finger protein HypA/HybF involved in hydrogenase expression
MSANDEFYCEYCEDTGFIELDDVRSVPCPHCNIQEKTLKNNEVYFKDHDWDGD